MMLFGGASGPGLSLGAGKDKAEVEITGVLKDGSASWQGSGLKVGDVVVEVDSQKVLSVDQAASLLRGNVESVVQIKVLRRGLLGPEVKTAWVKRGVDKKFVEDKKRGEVAKAKATAAKSSQQKTGLGGGGSGGWFGSAAPKAMDAVWDPFAAVRGPGLVLGKGKAPGEVVITGIEKGGPVDRQSGVLRVGDVVVGVDDEAVRGLSVDTVSSKLRGPTGSSVRIKALRRGMTGEEHVTSPPFPVLTGQVSSLPSY